MSLLTNKVEKSLIVLVSHTCVQCDKSDSDDNRPKSECGPFTPFCDTKTVVIVSLTHQHHTWPPPPNTEQPPCVLLYKPVGE